MCSVSEDINNFIEFLYKNDKYLKGIYPPSFFIPQSCFVCHKNRVIVDQLIEYNDDKLKMNFLRKAYSINTLPNMLKDNSDKQAIYNTITKSNLDLLYKIYYDDYKLIKNDEFIKCLESIISSECPSRVLLLDNLNLL